MQNAMVIQNFTWKGKVCKIAKILKTQRNVKGCVLPDFKTYFEATVAKILKCSCSTAHRPVEQSREVRDRPTHMW